MRCRQLQLLLAAALLASLHDGALASAVTSFPPFHYLNARAEPATNITSQNGTATALVKAGITPVSITSDRQSYYTIAQVGVIRYRITLDTASSDFWITSSSCTTDNCDSIPRLPLDYPSATFQTINGNATIFSAGYADGTSASGFVAMESLSIANITVTNQTIGVVTESTVSLVDYNSGVFGLGFPRLSSISASTNTTPFFVELSQAGILEYPLFGLHLTRNDTGSLSFGAVDASIVTNASQIGWNDVAQFSPFTNESTEASYLEWVLPLTTIYANDTEVVPSPTYPEAADNQSLALLDIGTSGIYGPWYDVERIFETIEGARLVDTDNGLWAVPCDTVQPLTFVFGERNYTLQPTEYFIGPVEGNPNMCLSWPAAMASTGDGIDWQLGSPFLRTVYSIFSFGIDGKEPPMIGLYPLSNMTDTTESIADFFASEPAVVPTTLPNVLLPTPSPSAPSYIFNTSVPASIGAVVESGLATESYTPILDGEITALPLITPGPQVVTTTDKDGATTVITSYTLNDNPVLGVPPGWNSARGTHVGSGCAIALVVGVVLALLT